MALDPKYKAVGFDMDGTFMNSDVDYAALANLVFDEMVSIGVPEAAIDREEGSKFNIDSGVRWLEEHGRGNDVYQVSENISKRAREIEMCNADRARPYPGALEVLKMLKTCGYRTGILTRGCREYSMRLLGNCGALECLDGLVARDDHPECDAKPSPKAIQNLASEMGVAPEEILFVGDHQYDYLTAAGAGAGFIGVLTGTYTREKWRELNPDILVINSIYDLKKMLE